MHIYKYSLRVKCNKFWFIIVVPQRILEEFMKMLILVLVLLLLSGCIGEKIKLINPTVKEELENNVKKSIVGLSVTPVEEFIDQDLLSEELKWRIYVSEPLVKTYNVYKIKENNTVLIAVSKRELFDEPIRLELNKTIMLFGFIEKDTKGSFYIFKAKRSAGG